MDRVKGKVAVVTGGAGGMGEAIVKKLSAEGAKVVFTDVLDKEGAALENTLGENVRFMHHDVTKESEWQRVIKDAEALFGPINVLVNNAGITHVAPIESYAESDFRRLLDINLFGVFLGMKTVVPSMRRAGSGAIINMSSTAGLRGFPGTLAYTAAKFAVRGMTKTAALELAPTITVNSIHPGPTRTPMIVDPADGTGGTIAEIVAQIPAKRMGEPEEVANVVLLLATDEIKIATGAEFVLDGGLTCR